MMDGQIFQILGGVAGLAGLAVGLILFIYREILSKSILPQLSKRDAYRLLRNIAFLSWSIAMVGIFCWAWSAKIPQPSLPAAAVSSPEEDLVVAGTIVDRDTNSGLGQAKIAIVGESSSITSEDTGNFRIVLPVKHGGRVRLTVTKIGYLDVDQSVMPPAHDVVLQMIRAK
jgi:hypothetical protein